MSTFKVLNREERYGNNGGTITEIVSFKDSKFRIISDIHNGGRDINVKKMNTDGIFVLVLDKNDLPNHSPNLSYVSDDNKKKIYLEETLKAIKNVIKTVY